MILFFFTKISPEGGVTHSEENRCINHANMHFLSMKIPGGVAKNAKPFFRTYFFHIQKSRQKV